MASADVVKLAHPYTNFAAAQPTDFTVITRGDGPWVYDSKGKRYFEGMSGLYSVGLGFANKRLVDAITAQLNQLPYYQTFFYKSTDAAMELSERLIEVAPVPMKHVMLQSSGSEANDTAVKIAWLYWMTKGEPARRKIIGRHQGYHGTSIITASLSDTPHQHAQYGLPLPGFLHADCPHYYRFGLPGETEEQYSDRLAENLEKLILREGPDTIAAFFAEPIIGSGGAIPPPATYFEKVQKVLKKYKILFVVDEVINGFGRTGKMWGTQHFNLQPDMMVSAKMLSSSYLPISALLIGERVSNTVNDALGQKGFISHGYTYGGHPVCAAAALEVLNIYRDEGIVDKAAATGDYVAKRFNEEIASLPIVGEVRGKGLLWGIQLVADKKTKQLFDPEKKVAAWSSLTAAENGLIVRAVANDALIFSPPLITTKDDVDYVINVLKPVLEQAHAKFGRV
ncbi:aminotransferase (plasmid) [Mesorhizobium sp. ORM8.1]